MNMKDLKQKVKKLKSRMIKNRILALKNYYNNRNYKDKELKWIKKIK
jgi:hypothetical protein